MKRRIILPTTLMLAATLLVGCSATANETTGSSTAQTTAPADGSTTKALSAFTGDLSPDVVLAANADYTTVNTDEWSADDAVDVKLSGTSATVASGVNVEDGTVAIHLADGTENSVSDAFSYADEAEANAAIYAASDLTISGEGALTVTANGNDGITSKDDLVILSGDITVWAADDALRGKDSLVVEGGTLNVTATAGDGMKSDHENDETKGYILITDGTINITAGDDGIQAQTDVIITGGKITAAVADDGVKGEQIVSIGGGTINITKSEEGIEAINVAIFDGTLDITASDDGINASGLNTGGADRETDTGERLEISGGTITVNAGFDGLDSNGTITVSGGTLDIMSADNGGDTPFDANGEVSVTGGTITANGAAYDASQANRGPGGGGGMGSPSGGGMGGPGGPGGPPSR